MSLTWKIKIALAVGYLGGELCEIACRLGHPALALLMWVIIVICASAALDEEVDNTPRRKPVLEDIMNSIREAINDMTYSEAIHFMDRLQYELDYESFVLEDADE